MVVSAIVAVIGIIFCLMVGLAYPAIMMFAVLCTPVFKLGLMYYLPFFQTVDLTVLVCLMVLIVGVANYLRNAKQERPLAVPWGMIACLACVAALMFVGLGQTTAPISGWQKAVRFTGIGIPFLLIPTFFVRREADGYAMLRMVVFAGILTSLFLIGPQNTAVSEEFQGGYGRNRVLGGSAGGAAQVVGMAVLVMLVQVVIKGSAPKIDRLSGYIGLPLGLIAILLSGSRSGLLYLFLSAGWLPFIVGKRWRARALMILYCGVPLIFGVILVKLLSGDWALGSRWTSFFEGGEAATSSRTVLWSFVFQNWWRRPILGHGCAAFSMDYLGVDAMEGPHNIILEALYEEGPLGALLVIVFLILIVGVALRGIRLARTGTPQECALISGSILITMYLGLRAMSSVDLDGMRFLYLVAALLYANVEQVAFSQRRAMLARALAARAGPVTSGTAATPRALAGYAPRSV